MNYFLLKLKTLSEDRVFRANLELVRETFLVKMWTLYQKRASCVKCFAVDSFLAGPAGNRTPETLLDKEGLEPIRAQQRNSIKNRKDPQSGSFLSCGRVFSNRNAYLLLYLDGYLYSQFLFQNIFDAMDIRFKEGKLIFIISNAFQEFIKCYRKVLYLFTKTIHVVPQIFNFFPNRYQSSCNLGLNVFSNFLPKWYQSYGNFSFDIFSNFSSKHHKRVIDIFSNFSSKCHKRVINTCFYNSLYRLYIFWCKHNSIIENKDCLSRKWYQLVEKEKSSLARAMVDCFV